MANHEKDAQVLIQEAERDLDNIDPGPFSPQAFRLLKLKVSDYVRALILESGRIAGGIVDERVSPQGISGV